MGGAWLIGATDQCLLGYVADIAFNDLRSSLSWNNLCLPFFTGIDTVFDAFM
jgi:hypothetical protein